MAIVCDELGDCYDTGSDPSAGSAATGGAPADSGDPCDPTSVAYDPVACANASGGFSSQGGLDTPWANNPSLETDEINFCNNNPGMCDGNGVTATYVDQYCQQYPQNCDTLPDGTVGTTTASGSVKPAGGGPTFKVPNTGTTSGGASGGFLGGLSSFLNNLFGTCPPGFVKAANGQCVSGSTIGRTGNVAGFGNGMIGGVSIGTILLIVLVLFLISRKKG